MVHRKGSRFGVNTNHKVKRLPFPYQHACAQQSVVVKTKLDAPGPESKKRAETHLKRQLQKDSFNAKPDETSQFLTFSLNKAKRWQVIEEIKEDTDHHGNHYIIQEQYMRLGPSHTSDRGTVEFLVSLAHPKMTPARKSAKSAEIITEPSDEIVVAADFGKKNSKRSRRRRDRGKDDAAESVIQYDVIQATPRNTYQTSAKSKSCSEHRHRNSRNRSKKFQHCRMIDAAEDELWQLSDYSDEEDDASSPDGVEMVATSYEVDLESLVTGVTGLPAVHDQNRVSPRVSVKSAKDRVFPMEGKDEVAAIQLIAQAQEETRFRMEETGSRMEEKRMKRQERRKGKGEMEQEKKTEEENWHFVVPKSRVVAAVNTDDITDENLTGLFGDCFIRGLCRPRRFVINITDRVIRYLASCAGNLAFSRDLQETGHQIFIIFECSVDPWVEMREGGRLVERVMMKVSGVNNGKKALKDALADLESDGILDVIEAVSRSVALLPTESFLMDKKYSSKVSKPELVMGTVQATLGWRCHTTYANKAVEIKQILNTDSEDGMVPVSQGASNACESCSICYTEFDGDNQGTALTTCNHWFCDECWRNHLSTQINQGNINITCPEFQCNSTVDKVTLMSLMPSKLSRRHHANQTNSALMLRSDLLWCPNPHCGRLVQLSHPESRVAVHCECGAFWCSGCKQAAHWPATCKQAKLYRDTVTGKLKKDRVIQSVNTKPCPQCKYPIEKDYGCDRMSCKCGCSFCWSCGKKTNECFGYNCKANTYTFKVYYVGPTDIIATAIACALRHKQEQTFAALLCRFSKINKLTSQLLKIERDKAMVYSEKKTANAMGAFTLVRLESIRKTLVDVANFLSEAEFVLEHLQIRVACSSNDCHKRALSRRNVRLNLITRRLHKIFKQEISLTFTEVEHLLNRGKEYLRWIAVSGDCKSQTEQEPTEE